MKAYSSDGEQITVLSVVHDETIRYCEELGRARIPCELFGSLDELLEQPLLEAGALLIPEESLSPAAVLSLSDLLKDQPLWSALPLIVLSGSAADLPLGLRALQQLRPFIYFILLERPVEDSALVAVVESVLRLRRRQFAIRDLLAKLDKISALQKLESEQQELFKQEQVEQVRSAAAAVVMAEQREREHMARVLNEDLQQVLLALKTQMELLKDAPSEHKSVLLEKIKNLTGNALQTTRSLASALSAPISARDGMETLLEWLAFQVEKAYGLKVEIVCGDLSRIPVENVRGLLFRLVRELLLDIACCVRATWTRIEVHQEAQRLFIEIKYDGEKVNLLDKPGETDPRTDLPTVFERLRMIGGNVEYTPEDYRIAFSVPIEPV